MVKKNEIPPAAVRALKEAEERRNLLKDRPNPKKEFGGRDGPEPVRFGDWERKGLAIDFLCHLATGGKLIKTALAS